MRRVLRYVATRYGAAGLIVLAVLVVVLVARLTGGGDNGNVTSDPGHDTPQSTVSQEPDDGVAEPTPTAEPTLPAGHPDPLPAAETFTRAWIDHSGLTPQQWHQRLSVHTTKALADKLRDTDPADVPAKEITGEPTLSSLAGTELAQVEIPVDAGTLRLGLLYTTPEGKQTKQWLVDTIDWDQS